MVSIITVNYNGYKDTCELIDSLRRYETYPYEIIVVDNASTENEAVRLKAGYPEIIAVRSDRNLGFAGGNNEGYRYATGEYILYMNNDTEIKAPFLEALVDRFVSAGNAGAVSPKIKFAYAPQTIQYAGFTPMSSVSLRNRRIGDHEKDTGQYNTACETAFVHGACMLTSRSVLEKAGLMTAVYFLFYEELDWSNQLRRAGYTIWYEPAATIYHKESKSVKKKSPVKYYYLTRARILYARRNRTGLKKLLSCFYLSSVVFPKNLLSAVMHNRPEMVKAYTCGTWHGLIDKKAE